METKTLSLFTVYMPPKGELMPALEQTLYSGYIGQGPKVDQFEASLGAFLGNTNILTLNAATSALHLAMRLIGVTTGDEVITTAMTCTATNMPILANGGTIVWADIHPETGLIDPTDIERKITPKTKAIVCVDWGGTPCDMDRIMAIAAKYHLPVVEDAAHALGAYYKGRKVGTIADYTVFSFQAIKHISTVDGGILCVKDTQQYKRGKLLRWYGIDREGERKDFRCEEDILEWGYKFHMNDVNATIGLAALPHADEIIDGHYDNAAYYDLHLSDYFVRAHETDYDYRGAFWLYTILLPTETDRLAFMQYMKEHGVMVSQVHARNDTHTTFAPFRSTLPGLESFVARQVSIPVHWRIADRDRERIAKLCNAFAQSR